MLSHAARRAHTLYRQRRLPEACRAFAAVVAREPQAGEVRRLYGMALRDAGQKDAAIEQLKTAVVLDRAPESMRQLAEALRQTGRRAEARQCLEALLRRDQDCVATWRGLAALAIEDRDDHQAASLLREALARAPLDVAALTLFGTVGTRLGFVTAARAALMQAKALVPREADALIRLADALCQADLHDDGLALYEAALVLRPNAVTALGNRGAALLALGRPREALASLEQADRLQPDTVPVTSLLLGAWRNLGDLDRAAEYAARTLRLDPGNRTARANRATLLSDAGRFEAALAEIAALRADFPDDAELARFEGLVQLLLGRFEAGWEGMEARLRIGLVGRAAEASAPIWAGEPLQGRRILMAAEEGYGDTLHMIRYASLLAARGAVVEALVPAALRRLLASAPGLAALHVDRDALPAFDFEIPMLSLPRAFATRLETIPNRVPYLSVDAADTARWRTLLADAAPPARLRVGLVWAGNPKHGNNHHRSLAWPALAPLTAVPDVAFFSLQVGAAEAALRADPRGVANLAPLLTDYYETAAAISALDLMITVDTSVAHVAGALGRPVWTLVSHAPDWRWLLERLDTPWYPTMRLFRAPGLQGWTSVIADVVRCLSAHGAGAMAQ